MASDDELNELRSELDARITSVSVELMGALGSLDNHGKRFDRVDARFDRVDRRLDHLSEGVGRRFADTDRRFDEAYRRMDLMDRRFDRLDARFDRVDARLQLVDTKLDRRFGWQTFLLVVVGVISVLDEQVAQLFGL